MIKSSCDIGDLSYNWFGLFLFYYFFSLSTMQREIWDPKEIRVLSCQGRAYSCRDGILKCSWLATWIQIHLETSIRHSPDFHANLFLDMFPGWWGRMQWESAGRSLAASFHRTSALLCLSIPSWKMGTAPVVLHHWVKSSTEVVNARHHLYMWFQLSEWVIQTIFQQAYNFFIPSSPLPNTVCSSISVTAPLQSVENSCPLITLVDSALLCHQGYPILEARFMSDCRNGKREAENQGGKAKPSRHLPHLGAGRGFVAVPAAQAHKAQGQNMLFSPVPAAHAGIDPFV